MKTKLGIIAFIVTGMVVLGGTWACASNDVETIKRLAKEREAAAKMLAQESEAACVTTASVKATPQMIIDKVNKACALIEKEGKASFSKFQGKDSEFIFAGTYIWINSFSGIMEMHPIKYGLNGKQVIRFRDALGKKYFVEFIETCKNKGEGWVEYMWPKPGQKAASHKVSYVKKAILDGKEVVVGCGVYGMSMEEIKNAMK
ncbi:MAG: cache domain-containing protein [Desulfobulbaceae bacterium]|nr:cache domain-containing protein [Desulfobulbaceae bacterium]